ncbi:hypothetical protein DL766_010401 [Monosporascus sp. MC13-8B]|uniref:Carrier domain-containing protein n=1 Tax=Monosporascus cannonballus TaxID=155416 RepID=A0ABY0HBW2_9PEZI|nr:hypothetical protein DL762_002955 [Monosporascus cannonballus]RYO96606.1 hypothetical protein DL763_003092 [Monosporascus cannonballus]RYP02364.1 hypothetical protein DL766_010401 [Monosporascus sp. MC13-8B]
MALQSTENLWPNAIRSRVSNTRPYATVVNVNGQCQDVTFSDLENASNRAAWFLDQNCPDDTFIYMGPSDLRYIIWVLAAMKTGKCAVYPSLANPIPANRKFFTTVGAKSFLYAPEMADKLEPLRTATEDLVDAHVALGYQELMSRDQARLYPFDSTWDEVKDVRFMGLHTSGTSGHPKPIFWNHSGASILPSFLQNDFSAPNGTNLMRDLLYKTTVLLPFPMFHLGGIGPAMASVFCDNTLVVPASGTPLSPMHITAVLDIGKCNAVVLPPSVLESLLTHAPALETLSKLDHVAYMGGPLDPARGAELAKHCRHLYPLMASTEGAVGQFESSGDSSHYNTFKFIDVGQRMEEMVPGLYELVYPRTRRAVESSGFFHVYPHLEAEYRTSDLFSPTGDGWWIYRGRADNWVVMSNGLKMDPTDMEQQVARAPNVKGVLVAGSYRFRMCMLIELDEAAADEAQAREEIWPLVDQANKNAPKFGQVPKELLLIAKPSKPFLRAAKGTVQRRLTLAQYDSEIDQLYNDVEKGLLTSELMPIVSTQIDDLVPFLLDLHTQTLDFPDDRTQLSADDDLLSLGIDSLITFILLARLKAALRQHGTSQDRLEKITPKLWYSTTTIRQMASTLSIILSSSGDAEAPGEAGPSEVEKILARFTEKVQELSVQPAAKPDDNGDKRGATVLLTGSTGSLGSYILSSLLSRSDVKKVICLNRSGIPVSRSKHIVFLQQVGGLPPDTAAASAASEEEQGRVRFMQAKIQEPRLGLSDDEYAMLVGETTSIIHNAFPVNFLLSVGSFEPAIQALVNLLDLAVAGHRRPPVMFVSSISAATLSSSSAGRTVPEDVISAEQARNLLPMGYAQAKYICESLLKVYAESSSSPAVVLRVGQICGPISGKRRTWNPTEWLPSLAISSKFLGAAPDSLGRNRIDWVPVDELANIICQLTATTTALSDKFVLYNVVNPQIGSWSDLLPALDRASSPLARLSPAQWIAKVEQREADGGADGGNGGSGTHLVHQNPALKLLDFYKQSLLGGENDVADVDIKNLLAASETARHLRAIQQRDMASWVEAWGL